MVNQIYNAYDIHLNSNNELMVAKYKVYDETIEGRNGKRTSYRHYNYLGVDIPENIEDEIYELQQEGYLPMTRFKNNSFDIETKNPLVSAKLMLLGFHHQILEKFYSLGHGYKDIDLMTYVTYINMTTGKISVMETGRQRVYDNMAIRLLEDEGYVPEERSFYYLVQNQDLDSEKKR